MIFFVPGLCLATPTRRIDGCCWSNFDTWTSSLHSANLSIWQRYKQQCLLVRRRERFLLALYAGLQTRKENLAQNREVNDHIISAIIGFYITTVNDKKNYYRKTNFDKEQKLGVQFPFPITMSLNLVYI